MIKTLEQRLKDAFNRADRKSVLAVGRRFNGKKCITVNSEVIQSHSALIPPEQRQEMEVYYGKSISEILSAGKFNRSY